MKFYDTIKKIEADERLREQTKVKLMAIAQEQNAPAAQPRQGGRPKFKLLHAALAFAAVLALTLSIVLPLLPKDPGDDPIISTMPKSVLSAGFTVESQKDSLSDSSQKIGYLAYLSDKTEFDIDNIELEMFYGWPEHIKHISNQAKLEQATEVSLTWINFAFGSDERFDPEISSWTSCKNLPIAEFLSDKYRVSTNYNIDPDTEDIIYYYAYSYSEIMKVPAELFTAETGYFVLNISISGLDKTGTVETNFNMYCTSPKIYYKVSDDVVKLSNEPFDKPWYERPEIVFPTVYQPGKNYQYCFVLESINSSNGKKWYILINAIRKQGSVIDGIYTYTSYIDYNRLDYYLSDQISIMYFISSINLLKKYSNLEMPYTKYTYIETVIVYAGELLKLGEQTWLCSQDGAWVSSIN